MVFFLEFVVLVMEKEDKQKVIGGSDVWINLTLLGLLEKERMVKYIKPRTKTQVSISLKFLMSEA